MQPNVNNNDSIWFDVLYNDSIWWFSSHNEQRSPFPTVLWTEDNFVLGQILKFRLMYTCGIGQSFRVFYHTFDEWKSRFGALSSQKKRTSKKKEKMPQNSQFWACFGVFKQLNLVRLNFAVAVKLYFVHLLLIKMVGMQKSREIAWNQVFCVINVNFSPNHKVFLGKMCPY